MIASKARRKWDYVLKEDRELEKKKQTVFHLRALDGDDRVQLMNLLQYPGNRLAYAITFGLKGWTNFKDSAGTDMPFPINDDGDCDVKKVTELLPKHWIELASAIIGNTVMEEGESKNSASVDISSLEG